MIALFLKKHIFWIGRNTSRTLKTMAMPTTDFFRTAIWPWLSLLWISLNYVTTSSQTVGNGTEKNSRYVGTLSNASSPWLGHSEFSSHEWTVSHFSSLFSKIGGKKIEVRGNKLFKRQEVSSSDVKALDGFSIKRDSGAWITTCKHMKSY